MRFLIPVDELFVADEGEFGEAEALGVGHRAVEVDRSTGRDDHLAVGLVVPQDRRRSVTTLPAGRSSFTACVWIGMVMISMISSTSITAAAR
jgi:hypothetical protein